MGLGWKGLVGLAVANVLLGVGSGHWFFRVFDITVPPAVVTSFNRTTAHLYFLLHGALLGVVLFLWCLAVAALIAFLHRRAQAPL